jgi:hypothetical protein
MQLLSSLLARTLASFFLGREPKARVTTDILIPDLFLAITCVVSTQMDHASPF